MPPDAAAAPRCAAAKALTQLGTATAKAPALLSLSPSRGQSGSAGHTVYEGLSPLFPTPYFWGVRGPSLLYPTLYIGSMSSLPRKRPKLGEPRVFEQAGGAGSVPGIREIRDKESAPLLPEQSKTCREGGRCTPASRTPNSSSAADSSNGR